MRRREQSTNYASGPALLRTVPLLVTGGAGFIGCNLADRLASEGRHVIILDSLSRPGVERNLAWLKKRHQKRITPYISDVRDEAAVELVQDVSGIFHLAAQVAVTASLHVPKEDHEINLGATLNLLEAVRRRSDSIPFVFASTNKVYGDLADVHLEASPDRYRPSDHALREFGVSEQRPLCFHTPYGCSKGAADQYVLDYANTFGLPTAVLRMSCIYGPRQCGTEDQGWVAHFIVRTLERQQITIFGDGRQVRDILHVDDAVEAYVRTLDRIRQIAGRAFNLGGGPANAVSLRQVLSRTEEVLHLRPDLQFAAWRPGDQRYYVSDTRSITHALDLPPPRSWKTGVAHLANWLAKSSGHRTRLSAVQLEPQFRP